MLTSDERVNLALVGIVFLWEFDMNENPERALDIIEAAIAGEYTLAGNA